MLYLKIVPKSYSQTEEWRPALFDLLLQCGQCKDGEESSFTGRLRCRFNIGDHTDDDTRDSSAGTVAEILVAPEQRA